MRNDLFLRACKGEPTERVPVWFMRQAGRSLPEYRAVRERHSILGICRTPELAVEVTLQPVRRLGVDAAILFSDIVVPLQAMGVEVEIAPGVGPVIESPIRSAADLDRLRPLSPEEDVPFVLAAVRALVTSSTFHSSGSAARRSRSRATSSRAARPGTTRARRR